MVRQCSMAYCKGYLQVQLSPSILPKTVKKILRIVKIRTLILIIYK